MFPLLSKELIESFIKNYNSIVDSINKNTSNKLKDEYINIIFYEESGGLYSLVNEQSEKQLEIIFNKYFKKFEFNFNDELNNILLEFGMSNNGMNKLFYIYDITLLIEYKYLLEEDAKKRNIKTNFIVENYRKLFNRINNNDLELLKEYYEKLIILFKNRLPFDDFP